MSRSYVHTPLVIQQYDHRRPLKRAAAKVIRRLPIDVEVGNGRAYCRHFPQYDLREHSTFYHSGRSRLFRKTGKYADLHFEPVTA